jgi:hypothetical protein
MINGGCAIPIGIQLKVFRRVDDSRFQVTNAGLVHNPLQMLQGKFDGSCPSFSTSDAVLDLIEAGLTLLPGDRIGLTIMSDSNSEGYLHPLIRSSTGNTSLVLRNVELGGYLDLNDLYTSALSQVFPAFSISLTTEVQVEIDIKPGSYQNSNNLDSAGTIPVAIFSTDIFDAGTIDADSLYLAGASVGLAGKSNKYQCSMQDVNDDSLPDLVCHFETAQFLLQAGDTVAVLVGKTSSGISIKGQDSISIVSK